MKLIISKDQILQGLQAVQNIVSTRTTLPILSNILFRADEKQLVLTATDLDVTISCTVEADVKEPGAITVPAKRFFGIVRELASLDLELEVDDRNICSIQSGPSFYKIHGMAAAEFPPLPQFAESKRVLLPQEKMKVMLKRTSFASSTDETRFVLNGIFLSLKEHKVTMVATDGRRLALSDEELEIPSEGHGEFIVPTKAINELSRLLQPTGDIEIRFTENQASFQLHDDKGTSILIVSKLVEGNYPNYRQVIPTECKERIPIGREELLHALRRAEIMTSDKQNSVKLIFTKNNLSIMANAPEVGEGRESIAVNYKGPDIAIAFNPTYMMDPLKALDNDEVFLELIDDLSPGVIKINGPFLYVLMPMRMT
jgi:DNA polymerase III subunit beta